MRRLNVMNMWRDVLALTFSYFALSAGIAAMAAPATPYVSWQTPLLVLPVMAASYVWYKKHFRFSAIANLPFATLPAGAREKAEIKAERLQ